MSDVMAEGERTIILTDLPAPATETRCDTLTQLDDRCRWPAVRAVRIEGGISGSVGDKIVVTLNLCDRHYERLPRIAERVIVGRPFAEFLE